MDKGALPAAPLQYFNRLGKIAGSARLRYMTLAAGKARTAGGGLMDMACIKIGS